ncbi:regulator of chromosome condensation 1/beta-lactamase-inhibitor protein II [Apiospora phragmitis]|uniref:Regulator of chromosome condensation 1/beta-lactamase-inhibitor protein II n=1 Tax=Apiospora phragmitis TaxID=2905665 RepID=A0ABR1W5L0_9PEZI
MAPTRRAAAPKAAAPAPAPKPAVKKSASKPAPAPKKAAAPKSAASKRAPPPPADESGSDASEVEEEEDEEDEAPAPVPTKAKRAPAPKKAAPAKKPTKAAAATNGEKKPSAAKAKTAAKPATKSASKANGVKRKVEETEEEASSEEEPKEEQRPQKKVKQEAAPKKVAAPKKEKPVTLLKRNAVLNHRPTSKLDVFVFGEGSSGELGLGSKKYEGKKAIDVKRPRLNHQLDADKVGVVALACGGMHAVALTHDGRILTWGQNDDNALGRDTNWDGGVRDIDDEESDDDDDDDSGMNPHESTPGEVDMSVLHPDAKITAVAACDSASLVLTDDGYVYAWGTFRGTDGIIGFTDNIRVQPTPARIPEVRNITRLAAGANHVLAMDKDGKVFTWGAGGQFQLGRRTIARRGHHAEAGLKPEPCGKFTKKHYAVEVAAGSYHSFYIDNNGQVWGWGLNNFSQTGLGDRAGVSDAMIEHPTMVASLEDKKVKQVSAGVHHSIACTEDGKVLTWGRIDGHQTGLKKDFFTKENAIFDEEEDGKENTKPRILREPTTTNSLTNTLDLEATFVAAGTDNNFAISSDGKVYSWGFSTNYQTGQGTIDDIEEPTLIDNTALRGRKVIWAGAGGQYSIVAAPHDDKAVNGN